MKESNTEFGWLNSLNMPAIALPSTLPYSCTGRAYRAEKKSSYVVWWSLFLLLLTTSVSTCQQHSRNHVRGLFFRSVCNGCSLPTRSPFSISVRVHSNISAVFMPPLSIRTRFPIGGRIDLPCTVNSFSRPTVFWKKNGQRMRSDRRIQGWWQKEREGERGLLSCSSIWGQFNRECLPQIPA